MECLSKNNLELSKQDNQMAKGLAVLSMVALHLFCRLENLPYTPIIYINNIPLVYYLGLFGDICVPIYCFCSGYAQYLLIEREKKQYFFETKRRIFRFVRHFWVVLLIFSFLGILLGRQEVIPGTLEKFLGNVFLYNLNYNGAWWFILTYIFLLLLSKGLYQIVSRIYWLLTIILFSAVYVVAYIFRFRCAIFFDHTVINWIWAQAILVGTSLLPYICGMIARKYEAIAIIRRKSLLLKRKLVNMLLFSVVFGLILLHSVIQSLIIAVVTGLGTLLCFYVWNKGTKVKTFFLFWGKHSTNIWLSHMFFYMVLFPDLVFKAKYPILIYLFMLLLCLIASYTINCLERLLISGRKNICRI